MSVSNMFSSGLLACCVVLGLSACGGGDGSGASGTASAGSTGPTAPAAQGYAIGGSVTGLSGTVVLQNNAGDDLAVSANGAFTFATSVSNGAGYNVTVSTQPATQTCTVTNGAGTVSAANVGNVSVVCATNAFKVGGSISGLNGTVILQKNGADSLSRSSNGAFVFAAPVAQGGGFAVTVQTNPVGQSCSVANGSGTMGAGDISTVAVTCTTNAYTVGGTLSGLSGGTVVLKNNGGDSLSRSVNGSFTFPSAVAYGNPYVVTVSSQPANLSCPVANASGTITGNVTNVSVSCSCASGYSACSGTCVDTATDSNNCGGCGVVCPANTACSASACVPAACSTNADCSGGDVCLGGTCQAPTCIDGLRDGQETDVDCGGGTCSACAAGRHCAVPSDCTTGVCASGVCQAASCFDGVKNGSETAIDCGGGACGACAAGQTCLVSTDCLSGACTAGVCH
ncbi:MAG: hypothetical protein KGJ38_04120 [Burkholderiaceae bacterium]|nr:hypothetical protein [Burkholderiaceae bacterium]